MRRRLATIHGGYYLVTGIWPLVSMRSFEWVTGRKTDRWLVRMVALLAAVIGLAILRDRDDPVDRALPVGSALAFGAIDVVYSAKGTIRPIYLGDAAVEAALIAGWLGVGPGERRSTEVPGPAASGAPSRTSS
jgi:hypothetical protein